MLLHDTEKLVTASVTPMQDVMMVTIQPHRPVPITHTYRPIRFNNLNGL